MEGRRRDEKHGEKGKCELKVENKLLVLVCVVYASDYSISKDVFCPFSRMEYNFEREIMV